MDKLKPCPFCGSDDVILRIREAAWVECNACHGKGAFVTFSREMIQKACGEKAVELWNRRAEDGKE
jgi:Lar family restriction alleviation protein